MCVRRVARARTFMNVAILPVYSQLEASAWPAAVNHMLNAFHATSPPITTDK
jgi:hypothetical protein